ncbi:hypothetical protein NL450_27155, partial [Klebsiella pneumoniae]|nr:hypothetical protein [Klebsiella pneumoniae]
EWRPEYTADRADINDLKELNKYKLRFGISVTDIGTMNYDKGVRNIYDLNRPSLSRPTPITVADFDNADNFDEFMKDNFNHTLVNGTV